VAGKSLRAIVEGADHLYAGRAEIANVERSVESLRGAEINSFEVTWRLARALFFLGQQSDTRDRARAFYREAVESGSWAARERPERVEGHFWLGVNLALLAQVQSPSRAVVHALQARRALRRAIALEPVYHAAGPLRVLARLQHKLPRLLGGGFAQAQANYERAIIIAGANTVTRIYFAELLLEMGAVERAVAELKFVLSAPLDPDWTFEITRDQRLARKMIKQLSEGQK
jgi:hypothetical protein